MEALSGGDSLYPLSAPLLLIMEPYRALGWKLVLHIFLAGMFMYGWIRTLGLSRASGIIAGLAFAMAPYMVSLVFNGQDGKIFVTALTPLAFMAGDDDAVAKEPVGGGRGGLADDGLLDDALGA